MMKGNRIVHSDGTLMPVRYAKVAFPNPAATAEAIALTAGMKIRILALAASSNGNTNINFQSHTTTANATSLMYLGAHTDVNWDFNEAGWFETTLGEALDIVSSGNIDGGVQIVYCLVPG